MVVLQLVERYFLLCEYLVCPKRSGHNGQGFLHKLYRSYWDLVRQNHDIRTPGLMNSGPKVAFGLLQISLGVCLP